jgi:hypothetical protein
MHQFSIPSLGKQKPGYWSISNNVQQMEQTGRSINEGLSMKEGNA